VTNEADRTRAASDDSADLAAASGLLTPKAPEHSIRVLLDPISEAAPRSATVLQCTVSNLGRTGLSPAPPNPVQLSYRVFRRGSGQFVEQGPRTPLAARLEPNDTTSLNLTFFAPAEPGAYVVRVTLVEELVTWLDEGAPANAFAFELTVRSSEGPTVFESPVQANGEVLPMPPLDMRRLVGPTEPIHFENPSGELIEPLVPAGAYESVFDFGCGCGRLARRLIQQRDRPARYLGIDLHQGMIMWCQQHFTRAAPTFRFSHHDVAHPWNPGPNKPRMAPFPAEDRAFGLVLAHSVFTHLTEDQAGFYMVECARILRGTGILYSTWFLFDKGDFPMLNDARNALYVDYEDPSGAVIFAKEWLKQQMARNGLTIYAIEPPSIRGYHWRIFATPARDGVRPVDFPEDDAPQGRQPPPMPPSNPDRVGR
jgi:SAM-dependent methyltransferase